MKRPLIGIVPLVDAQRESYWMLPGYMRGVEQAGGLPIMLPLTDDDAALRQLADTCDGFLLTGGQDVSPALYGAAPVPACGETCPARDAMETKLLALALEQDKPVLGICLGMQLMCRHSEEGDVDCLGIFDTDVKRFISQRHEDKVPHMGWNTIARTNSGLFKGFTKEEFVYFVHSFYVPVNDCTAAVTDYIHPFSAALHKDNYYATQFHPEKSGSVGERILRNFLEL